jgi:hypothetical protein
MILNAEAPESTAEVYLSAPDMISSTGLDPMRAFWFSAMEEPAPFTFSESQQVCQHGQTFHHDKVVSPRMK